jgi:nicotinamide riboside kinase
MPNPSMLAMEDEINQMEGEINRLEDSFKSRLNDNMYDMYILIQNIVWDWFDAGPQEPGERTPEYIKNCMALLKKIESS